MASKVERRKMIELAESGSAAAIQFLQETPHFMDKGVRAFVAWRILMQSGDTEVAVKYKKRREYSNRHARDRRKAQAKHTTMSGILMMREKTQAEM